MPSQVEVSFLAADQVQSVIPLFEAQFREHEVPSSSETIALQLQELLAQPESGFVLCATGHGTPVGLAYGASIVSLEHGGRSGWLEEFYVSPEWRGQGVGSALLAAFVATGKERGWRAIDLEVDAAHERTLPLYARHGFGPVLRKRFVRRLREPAED